MLSSDSSQSTIVFPSAKMVIAGDSGVGKTSLIHRYCIGGLEPGPAKTGVDFQVKIVEVNGKAIKLAIWDIAEQEQFGAFHDSFYRGARAVALVYDVTRPATMENLPRWHVEIMRICPTVRLFVVGNKIDLARQSSRAQVEEWARSLGHEYMETSALTGQGVDDLFLKLARVVLKGK